MNHAKLRTLTLATVLAALGCSDAETSYTLRIVNQSGADLVPYPVVTSPPPPHREAMPTEALANGDERRVDTSAFNPLFYSDAAGQGVLVQLGLDDDPPLLLARRLEYAVPPGDEGTDPALQPVVLEEISFEPSAPDITLTIGRQGSDLALAFADP